MKTNKEIENRELLYKELCALLPYLTEVQVEDPIRVIDNKPEPFYDSILNPHLLQLFVEGSINIKPYLRHMSTMTNEEKEEMHKVLSPHGTAQYDIDGVHTPVNHYGEFFSYQFMSNIVDWLREHSFDINDLLIKNLAIKKKDE